MDQINHTQLVGLTGFGTAALFCLRTAWRQKHARNIWIVLSIGYLIMFAEVLAQIRYLILGVIVDTLKSLGVYEGRQTGQTVLIVVAVCVVAFLSLLILSRMRNLVFSARLALVAGIFVLALYLVETISLHAIDAILFKQIGPVLLIGWLWLACGWTSAVAAAVAAKTHS